MRESPLPTMLHSVVTRLDGLPLTLLRVLLLLGVSAERHGERCSESAHRQEVDFHSHDLSRSNPNGA